MSTTIVADEWVGAPLRPVARWIAESGRDGRPRLVMRWAVPEVAPEAVRDLQSAPVVS